MYQDRSRKKFSLSRSVIVKDSAACSSLLGERTPPGFLSSVSHSLPAALLVAILRSRLIPESGGVHCVTQSLHRPRSGCAECSSTCRLGMSRMSRQREHCRRSEPRGQVACPLRRYQLSVDFPLDFALPLGPGERQIRWASGNPVSCANAVRCNHIAKIESRSAPGPGSGTSSHSSTRHEIFRRKTRHSGSASAYRDRLDVQMSDYSF